MQPRVWKFKSIFDSRLMDKNVTVSHYEVWVICNGYSINISLAKQYQIWMRSSKQNGEYKFLKQRTKV